MIFTPKHTILAFVKSLDLKKTAVDKYALAVVRFDQYLGRPSKLGDLTAAMLGDFDDWLTDVPSLKESTKRSYCIHLRAISRHAADSGVIELPIVDLDFRGRQHDAVDNTSFWSLLRYFEDVFLVARQSSADPFAPETVKAYRSAVMSFLRFAPPSSNVNLIDSSKIRAFRQRLVAGGMSPKKAGNHAFAVAAIVKHARPERFIEQAEELSPAIDQTRTLAYVFQHHMLPARQKIATVASEKKYLAVFHSFGRFMGKIATLDDLTDEKIGTYMRDLRLRKKAARTINGYRSKLVSIWTWCAKKRMVEQFPTIDKMSEPAQLPVAWTLEDLQKLMAGISKMRGYVGEIPAADWWRALHYVAWDTGERTGALLQLTWQMLDLKTGQLAVPAEFRKGGKKPMLYVLKPKTLELIRRIRWPERIIIFEWQDHFTMYHYYYQELLEHAGLPYVPYKSGLQKIRRSFATHLENLGGNATEAFNHGERTTTVNSYLDPKLIERTPPNEILPPLDGDAA